MKKVIIIGAGVAGRLLKKNIEDSAKSISVLGFIDDNMGTDVIGRVSDIPTILNKRIVDEMIIALPSERGKIIRKVLLLKSAYPSISIRILPRASSVVFGGEASYNLVRGLELTDLVGDRVERPMHEEITKEIQGKVVLVTGGGGSIGSELSTQIFLAKPRKLIVVDFGELNLFKITNTISRIKHNSPETQLDFVLGNVLNMSLMRRLFRENKIEYVYHASAYKHVPIVEFNAYEGLSNNFLSTYQTALLAKQYKVKKFVLISTDKAVLPINMMGKSKRLAELAVQTVDSSAAGIFTAVRFGNVFNSSGSAVQVFLDQLNLGKILTITDSKMKRYFMTIPEAVHLVLQTSLLAKKGKIYMLEMGESVSIEELAKCLAVLKGVSVADLHIVYSGLRPGEKLDEELFDSKKEYRQPTSSNKIWEITPTEKDVNLANFSKLKDDLIELLNLEHVMNHSQSGRVEIESIMTKLL